MSKYTNEIKVLNFDKNFEDFMCLQETEIPGELRLLDKMTKNVCRKWTKTLCNKPEEMIPFLEKFIDLKFHKKTPKTLDEENDCGIIESYTMVGKRFWKDSVNTRRAYKTPIIRFLTVSYSIEIAMKSNGLEIPKYGTDTSYDIKKHDLTDKIKKEIAEYREKVHELLIVSKKRKNGGGGINVFTLVWRRNGCHRKNAVEVLNVNVFFPKHK